MSYRYTTMLRLSSEPRETFKDQQLSTRSLACNSDPQRKDHEIHILEARHFHIMWHQQTQQSHFRHNAPHEETKA